MIITSFEGICVEFERHWFSYFQIAHKSEKMFMTDLFKIFFDDFGI